MARSDYHYQMKPKSVHKNTIIGQRGVNLVESEVLAMGHVWNPTTIDAGIDGIIELRTQEGAATNLVLQAQVKSTERTLPGETDESFRWPVDIRDVTYWLGGNAPVVLFVARPEQREVYWVDVKSYFADPKRAKDRSIVFDKVSNRFGAAASTELERVARPGGVGAYLGPPPANERLLSNLLEVAAFGPTIYVAQSVCDRPKEAWQILNEVFDNPPSEWSWHKGRIHSFVPLDGPGWKDIVDPGTVEAIEASHFSESDAKTIRRDFVWLLNSTLKARLRLLKVGWSKEHRCYYFLRRSRNGPDRTFRYQSTRKKSSRKVVKCFRGEDGTPRFCRHVALEASFIRDGGAWFLELVPTYHFTRDGRSRDGFRDQHLKKIKEFELNGAVRGQVVMWARILGDDDDPMGLGYTHLRFGGLREFEFHVGIDEEAWTVREARRPAPDDTLPLFGT
jgi:Domain of unknown function (DUF4365)